MQRSSILFAALIISFAYLAQAKAQEAAGPYKVVQTAKVGGVGGWDYVFADADGRRLYIPRSGGRGAAGRVSVYDLDTLKAAGEIPNIMGGHGVAVDPKSRHGFTSSKPVVMFDSSSLATLKTIAVEGNPDGILFDPATSRIFVLSHRAPNVTVLDSKNGSIVGTIDLGGAPEQAVSDGKGHVYIDVEDKDNIAAVDAKSLKVTAHYSLEGKGGGPGGLAIDARHHVLFAFCHRPATAVILNAENGKILATLPIGNGVDAGEFNPKTMEAFSSQRDGTLTVIKETSPTQFEVEQNVQTKAGARTSTLDEKTNRILLITAEQGPPPAGQGAGQNGRGRRGGAMLPDSFTILVVGR
ncbi:MAG TPA: hypothetical protein VFC78_23875 [Tepidisphaeraceae bacterium]|nr:hypothetical protein [Tepidisphaeraceae bacterium]